MSDQVEYFNRSLNYLKEEVDLVVACVVIADKLVMEFDKRPINGSAVAEFVVEYAQARARLAAFFIENPVHEPRV